MRAVGIAHSCSVPHSGVVLGSVAPLPCLTAFLVALTQSLPAVGRLTKRNVFITALGGRELKIEGCMWGGHSC